MTIVLLPVDGSPSATNAVAWIARELRGQPSARVHLLHVHAGVEAWEVKRHLGADVAARWQAEATARVLAPAASVLAEAGVAVDTHSASGEVARVVHEHVHRLGCDAIVMGTRGLSSVETLLLGSTAMKVLHLANVPVTLIK